MLTLITNTDEFKNKIKQLHDQTIGLVPTMGNLHDGHLSLIKRSLAENDVTIVTIFVNPIQFGPNEDLDKYPRTQKEDINQISKTLSSDSQIIVFAPKKPNEIYPKDFSTYINVKGLTEVLCGKSRPGHFEGVATVVYQLLTLSKANNAYFGQKDYQQLLVIERMAKDLNLDVNIVPIPIIREEDGLALSSRNQYLTPKQRKKALILYETLQKLSKTPINKIDEQINITLNRPFDYELKWDYIECLDAKSLNRASTNSKDIVIAGALYIEKTRLIDNIRIRI